MGKRRARDVWEYDSMADFLADGGSAYGAGRVIIGGNEHLIGGNRNIIPVTSALNMRPGMYPLDVTKGLSAFPQAAGISLFKFIDPSKNTNGQGTYSDPWQLSQMPDDVSTFTTNNTAYLFKRGADFITSKAFSPAREGLLIGAYGDGPKPVWRSGPTGLCLKSQGVNTLVCGLKFVSESSEGTNNRCIEGDSTKTNGVHSGTVIYGSEFSVPGAYTLTNERVGVYLHGANNKILMNVFDGIADDAVYLTGDNAEVAYNYIDNVGLSSGISGVRGDCCQFAGNAGNFHVHHNYMRNRTGAKQCLEASVANGIATSLTEHNIFIHDYMPGMDGKAVKLKYVNAIFRSNFVKAANSGVWLEAGATVESNIILADDIDMTGSGAALHMVGAGSTYYIRNNTILSPKRTGKTGLRYAYGTLPGVNSQLVNNIIQGFQTGFQNQAASGAFIILNNIWWANVVHSNYAHYPTLNTNVIADPRLNASYVPQEEFALLCGISGAANDYYGNQFQRAIGAVQPTNADLEKSLETMYWTANTIGY